MPKIKTPKPSTLAVRLSAEQREWIESEARAEGLTPSEFVRYLVTATKRGGR